MDGGVYTGGGGGGGPAVIGTPVFNTMTTGAPSMSIAVPAGTTALLLFYANETSGNARALNGVSDGVQNAAVITDGTTDAAVLGGAGPTLRTEVWIVPSPTVGTSTWTWDVSTNTSGLSDQTFGYAFVSDGNAGTPIHGTVFASAATTTTTRDGSIDTSVGDVRVVGFIAGRDLGDTFTWDPGITDIYNAGQTSIEVSVATLLATVSGTQNMGGDWSANPTRSNLIIFGLAPGV